MTQPTQEGLRRYPQTRGYHPDLSSEIPVPDHDSPCTCEPTCPARCSGECGCEACSLAYTIFCDEAGFFGSDGPTVTEEEALRVYRAI